MQNTFCWLEKDEIIQGFCQIYWEGPPIENIIFIYKWFYVFLFLPKNSRKSKLQQGSFQIFWKQIVRCFFSVLSLHFYEKEQ